MFSAMEISNQLLSTKSVVIETNRPAPRPNHQSAKPDNLPSQLHQIMSSSSLSGGNSGLVWEGF